jgi:GT2 family glycosyltransferase
VGGNLAIRREAVGRIGGYDVRMTRSQDTEYYHRCLAEGLQVCYEPTAVAAHKIGAERLSPGYFRRWRRRTGFYDAQRMPWTKRDALTVMPLWWYRAVLRLVGTWLASALARKPWLHRFRCELALHQQLGVFSGRLSLWPRRLVAVLTGRWTPDPRPGGAMTGGEA